MSSRATVRRLFLTSDSGSWDVDARLGDPRMVEDEPAFPGTTPREATALGYGRWDAEVQEPQRIRCAVAQVEVDGPTTTADALATSVRAILTVDGTDVATSVNDGRSSIILGSPGRLYTFDFGEVDVVATEDVRLTLVANNRITTLVYDGFTGYGLNYAWQPPEVDDEY